MRHDIKVLMTKTRYTVNKTVFAPTFEVFQGLFSSPILNHAFDVWLAEKYFKPSWKSGQTKNRTTRTGSAVLELGGSTARIPHLP